MADTLGTRGTLAVVPPAELEARLQREATAKATAEDQALTGGTPQLEQLPAYIKGQFEIFRNHRTSISGWNDRLLMALRTFNGQYSASVLSEISKFGGSQVYARLIAQKCRGASSLLRDVYLGADRPWGLNPPADPAVPPEIAGKIDQLVTAEVQQLAQGGQQVPPNDAQDRKRRLMETARDTARRKAKDQALVAEDKIEEILREGSFYNALAEFLVDLPIFPFAIIKGPVVKVVPKIVWPEGGGKPTMQFKPRLYWYRVSPFDIWFTPGVADIEYANVIEKHRITRADINDMLDLPGYNVEALRRVLENYGRGGLYDNWDGTDSERAVLESRENPAWNRSATVTMMEFNGNVQGEVLQEYGMEVDDPLRDYHVQAWCIGPECIKAQFSPSPRQRHPYFMTSFEKVPGTPVGNGLTDILADIQEVANATLRSLVNNMSMASGPQVVVKDDRLATNEDGEEIYPWKRWHTRSDPTSTGSKVDPPIDFFQPQSIANELMQVYQQMSTLADDISAIPKYVQGGNPGSGAGRTASGLAMLMGNSSKVLQSVSANVDRDVMVGALRQLFDMILLTDSTGLLTGEEEVTVLGVNVAIQKETLRQRQLEFLQATANPMDSQIVGLKGRAAILRSVSTTIGLPGEEIVPDEKAMDQMEQQQKQQQSSQPITDAVQKGVTAGVTAGAQAIVSEVVKAHIPEQIQAGLAITPPPGGGAPPQPPGAPSQMQAAGAQAQGMQQPNAQEGPPQTNTAGAGQGPGTGSPMPSSGPA